MTLTDINPVQMDGGSSNTLFGTVVNPADREVSDGIEAAVETLMQANPAPEGFDMEVTATVIITRKLTAQ